MDVAAQSDTTAGAPTGNAPAALNSRLYLPFVAKQEKQVLRRPPFRRANVCALEHALKPPWIWQARPR